MPLFTRAEAAKFLGVSVTTFDQHVRRQLPELKVGRLPRFRSEDLEAWLLERASGGSTAPAPRRAPPPPAALRPRLTDRPASETTAKLTPRQREMLRAREAEERSATGKPGRRHP
jgi:excisionase family DNA binding protein